MHELSLLECEKDANLPATCLTSNSRRIPIEIDIIPCDAEYETPPPALELQYTLGDPAIVFQYKSADISSCS